MDKYIIRGTEAPGIGNARDVNISGSNGKRPRIETNMLTDDIISDPALRKPINSYEPGVRDDVRRKYVLIGPCQPTTHSFPKTAYGDRDRCFQIEWYNNREWLEYSVSQDAAFCFYCYLFGDIKRIDQAFTKKGFRNWKKATEKFKSHIGLEGSIHKNARILYLGFKDQRQSVTRKFLSGNENIGAAYRARLTASVDVARLLLGLGLAFRGHDESSSSIQAMSLVSNVKTQLQNLRENGWNELLKEVSLFCSEYKIDIPTMEDNVPGRIRSKQATTYFHHFRVVIFYQVIDRISQEMENRFSESSTELLLCVACLDPKNSFANFDLSMVCRLAELYPLEFSPSDVMELKEELKIWLYEMKRNAAFSQLQNIGDLAKKMVKMALDKSFPLVYLLLELILVLPVATASVERAFSAMNIIKTNLRNKMGDEFLTDCLVCCIEKELFTNIDNEVIIQHFQNMKSRRTDLSRLSKD